jgi:protein-disulfide isomerase
MLVDEELKKADAKIQAGTPRAELYATLIKDAAEKKEQPKEPTRPGEPVPGEAYKAEIKGAPMKGAVKDALVTIVQFSDFQCPYCKRVEPTMDKIMEEYKGKVRIAWRNMPLPFHDRAMPAAIAAAAAAQQNKFWEMHHKLFETQTLDDASIEKYAKEISGLNFDKWKAAKEDKNLKTAVEAEMAAGGKIGARGTPAFFVNGVFLSGARPFEQFKKVIDEQITKAEELVKKGTPKAKVYDAIMKTAKAEVAGGGAKGKAEAPADNGPPKKIDIGTSPAKGPKDAPLTVVVFSDFQCPFCSKVEPSVTELEKTYPGKVRVVWKNYPLPFHDKAKGAAEAALAAGEQGKFWEMHDVLFKNQQALDPASLEKYAQELKLDMGKWKAAFETHKYAAQIDAEMKQGAEVGVSGTPATFINGRLLSGAVPFSEFQKIADDELAKLGGKKKAAASAQAAKVAK